MAEKKPATPSPHTVTQSNKLIEAAHTLTLQEKRLVLLAASKLDPRKPLPKDGFITIHAEDFADTFGMEIRHAYVIIDEASKKLFHRVIKRDNGRKGFEELRWAYHAKYKPGQGCVELGFSPTVVPHLTMLHKEFTSYQLRQIGQLSSFYAIRLYELMAQFVGLQGRYAPLDDLRQMLDLGDKYKTFKDLRKWVLDPGVDEINKGTDLEVAFKTRSQGRKVVGLDFSIRRKAGAEQQLDLNLPPREPV